MTDTVVERVRQDLLERSQKGINKYGVTLDRRDLTLKDWLQHAYEECLDQANYLKRCIVQIEAEEWAEKTLKEERDKEDQAWEDFREGAYKAWKKSQEINETAKEAIDKYPKTLGKLKEEFHPKIEDGLY